MVVPHNCPVRSETPSSYLRAWLANPFGFGAIAPSGPALAALITSELTPETGRVLELGTGKGALTGAILERGVAESDLVLVERRPDFAALLRQRFPSAQVASMDAMEIAGLAHHFETQPLGAIVSGLPLLTMPSVKVDAILAAGFELLRPGGAFYQFTYSARSPVPRARLEKLGLDAERIGWAFLNIPPASVYRISRKHTVTQ